MKKWKVINEMSISELCKINLDEVNEHQLHRIAIRTENIKSKFDWYLKNGGISVMISDGIDIKCFWYDYRKILDLNKDLDKAFEKIHQNREDFLRDYYDAKQQAEQM